MPREEPQRTVATIDRAIDILALFANTERPDLGVTEIAQAVGLSKAVVHRTLMTLLNKDFLTVDPTSRRYRLGPMVLALGAAYAARIDIRRMALPYMQELSDSTNETATLSIRRNWTRVYVDQVTPNREVRMTVQLGVPFPLHAGSSSKAFLAFLPESEQDLFFAHSSLDPLTANTITNPRRLREQLAECRRRGYATSEGERQPSSASVAAPVFGQDGSVVAVMSVCGPQERMRDKREEYAELLLKATSRLSRELGYSTPDR